MYKNVTEEVKLRENDYCYRLLFEHSPVAIIVHSDGGISFTNPYAIELMGGKSS
ncbi:PAS domain-containing protein [Psychrobacillus sp. FJAT-51614]|uniref:PAS domain-containing protein n=1 Tax=Psychrobacillus mangrovi TaxID=3117745 RepID=A0ABU8F8M8_9BACI